MSGDLSANYEKAFYIDGSLRDIYVLETDEQDWQKLLAFLRSGPYALEFFVGDQLTPLPENIEAIFALQDDLLPWPYLHIDKEHLDLDCFFFTREEIDFDLDPRNFQGNTAHQQISRLLDFLRTVGQLLNKTIILTSEGGSSMPLFRFDPETDTETWFWDQINMEYQRAQWTTSRDN